MKKLLVSLVLFAIISFVAVGSASAMIIDLPDNMFRDQVTDNVWMDFSQFYNQTYAQVEASLVGTGFHLATLEELMALQSTLPLDVNGDTWLQYESIMGANAPSREIIWGIYDSEQVNSINWSWKS